MIKTAISYCRYSSDNQREESIDAQKRAINEYASRNGYNVDKYYIDEAKTATTDNRAQFQQLFKDIRTRKYDALIVHKLDRFARDRYDSAMYRHKLKESGMVLLSVLENFDGSPESIILESVLEGMAEYYSKNLSREVKKGMRETAFQGRHTGGIPPLGYNVDKDGFYNINPVESSIVLHIFEMYALDKSYREMADILNSTGCKTKVGKTFTKFSFHDMLCNEKYKGVYVFDKTAGKNLDGTRNNHKFKPDENIIRTHGGIPAIVSIELWEEVNRKMRGNIRSGAKKAKRTYLLSGIIYCGECDSPMSGNTRNCGRNKDEYSTYDCNRRKREKTCSAKSINKSLIENIVLDYLAEDFFSENSINNVASMLCDLSLSIVESAGDELPALKLERSRLIEEKNKIVDAMINKSVTEWLNERAIQVKERLDYIDSRMQSLERKSKLDILDLSKIKGYLLKDKDIKNKSPEEQKSIIQTYVERINVYHDYIDINTIVDLSGEGEPLRFISTILINEYRHLTQ